MADLHVARRQGFTWLWWVLGIALVGALLWLVSTQFSVDPPEGLTEPNSVHERERMTDGPPPGD